MPKDTGTGTEIRDTYTAVGIAEGFIECEDNERVLAAWQYLIDHGVCWRLQGWFGRRARDLIASGDCHAAEGSHA